MSAVELYNRGEQYFNSGDYYQAIDYYKESLSINPRYLDVIKALARTYFIIEEYDEALEFIQQAKVYGKNDPDLYTLEGRILVGKGELLQAEKIFGDVIKKEPNNVEANLGLAEIYLIRNEFEKASTRYQASLAYAPESRRALLSLVILHDARFETGKAESYLEKAVLYHPDDPQVYHTATVHYLKTGNLDKALYYAEELERLLPDSPEVVRLKGYLLILNGSYDSGIELLNSSLRINQEEPLTWYLLAIGYWYSGRTDLAVRCFDKVLILDPRDEAARIALENLLIDDTSLEDSSRSKYADYHFREGRQQENKYFFDRALNEYRRGMVVAPHSPEGWLLFAGIYKKRGFPDKYLDKLLAMRKDGLTVKGLDKEIEKYQREKPSGVAEKWKIDQFNAERKRYKVSLFYIKDRSHLIHYSAEYHLVRYLSYVLNKDPFVESPEEGFTVYAFSEAFRTARERGSDYFVIFRFSETERTFSCSADLYLAKTGSLITSFSILRTGNRMVTDALEKTGDTLLSLFPDRAALIALDENVGVINSGYLHNVSVGDKFYIVRKGKFRLISALPYREIPPQEILGTFTVTVLDEEIAEGSVERNSPFDLLNLEDECFPVTGDEEETLKDLQGSVIDYELKNQLLKIY